MLLFLRTNYLQLSALSRHRLFPNGRCIHTYYTCSDSSRAFQWSVLSFASPKQQLHPFTNIGQAVHVIFFDYYNRHRFLSTSLHQNAPMNAPQETKLGEDTDVPENDGTVQPPSRLMSLLDEVTCPGQAQRILTLTLSLSQRLWDRCT